MKKYRINFLASLSLILFAFYCSATQAQVAQSAAFQPCNVTITFTANTSGNIPTPVQATCGSGSLGNTQYLITNVGANYAFISYGTSAIATANCVVPTGTATATVPLLAGTQIVITTGAGSYFCGITTSGTSVIYLTPGVGL